MTLTSDIFLKGKKIASKGDKVKLISNHGNVLIVELNGNKFSVLKTETA